MMVLLYIGLGISVILFLALIYLMIATDRISPNAGIREHEYKQLYLMVKQEFNKGMVRGSQYEIMERCLKINKKWSNERNDKGDNTALILIMATIYLSTGHLAKENKMVVLKYKIKYFNQYIKIKNIVDNK